MHLSKRFFVRGSVLFGFIFLSLCALIYTQYYPYGHDENMYVLAPWLWMHGGTLYESVTFLQSPLLPFIYRGIYAVTGAHHLFLFFPRLLNGFAFIGFAASVGVMAFVLTKRRWVGFIFFLMAILHENILFASRQADNAILPLFLLAVGTGIWLYEM